MSSWREELIHTLGSVLGVAVHTEPRTRVPDPLPSASDKIAWPSIPNVPASDERFEFWKLLYASQLQEIAEQRRASDSARSAPAEAEHAHDFAVRTEMIKAYLDVAKGAPERVKAAAQFVQTAASAVATVYTALLALSFGTGSDAVRLDPRALAPGMFLGLAIALASAFLAFVTPGEPSAGPQGSGDIEIAHVNRLNAFIQWSRELVLRRVYLLRASVISLSVGVALLPVPFIDPQQLPVRAVITISLVGLALTLLWPLLFGSRYIAAARGHIQPSILIRLLRFTRLLR
jgi:hypothetical protein